MREDWVKCTLGEVVAVSSGKGLTAKNMTGSGYPVYGGNGITGYHSDFIYDEKRLIIGRVGVKCGVTHITEDKSWITDNALIVTFNSDIFDLRYLKLKLQYENLNKLSSSTAQPVISGVKIYAHEIEFSPLPEQRAIVAKIEELFSDLDKGIADLKKAQNQLKVYRQAVLKKAFEGELTKGKTNPKIIKLGSVIEKPRYGTSKKCSLEPKGTAVLRIPNIGAGIVNSEELKYAFFDEKEVSTLALREGDILTIRSNGSVDLVGKCALITKKDTNYLYAGYLIRLRPDLEKVDSKFLLYCLKSHDLRVQIESKAKSTSGVNNINSGELESLEIPFFRLEEQHQIVQEIESRLSVCDKVEQSISESLEKAKALRQSILKKAFEGTLLSEEEIAACKAAPDYEPASVLLARIERSRNERIKGEKKN